jgi:hypothetical protein
MQRISYHLAVRTREEPRNSIDLLIAFIGGRRRFLRFPKVVKRDSGAAADVSLLESGETATASEPLQPAVVPAAGY